ncbi:MAG: DUF4446 family protein [Alicyclobacillaceae bacterium]|nr:DUF4446 family protein [Alicyclobacillaceae bacterium]
MFSSVASIPLWYWVAAIGVLLVLLWLVVLVQGVRMARVQRRYRQWVGRSGTDLDLMLPNIMEQLQQLSNQIHSLEERMNQLETRISGTVRTARVVRYKAFDDLGSDLSFSAAWLDGEGNGVIISSIYGRDESRMYAKPVERGQSSYPLSEEEKKVLQEALRPGEPGKGDSRSLTQGLRERL